MRKFCVSVGASEDFARAPSTTKRSTRPGVIELGRVDRPAPSTPNARKPGSALGRSTRVRAVCAALRRPACLRRGTCGQIPRGRGAAKLLPKREVVQREELQDARGRRALMVLEAVGVVRREVLWGEEREELSCPPGPREARNCAVRDVTSPRARTCERLHIDYQLLQSRYEALHRARGSHRRGAPFGVASCEGSPRATDWTGSAVGAAASRLDRSHPSSFSLRFRRADCRLRSFRRTSRCSATFPSTGSGIAYSSSIVSLVPPLSGSTRFVHKISNMPIP
jgi:hypothetical protein